MNCSKKSPKKKGCALRREKSKYELQVNLASSELLQTRCRHLILTPNQEHLYTKRTILLKEKKWITIPTNYRRWSMKTVSIDNFVQDRARDFSDDEWSRRQHKEQNWILQTHRWSIMLFRSYWRTLGSVAVDPILMGYVLISQHWKKYLYNRGRSCDCQSVLEYGLIPGGKEKVKARQAVFLTPTNPLGNDLEEERAHDDLPVPQKGPSITSWKPTAKCSTLVYDCQKRRTLDWNSGRRSRLQSWPMRRYLEIALIVWHQMVEMEHFY